MPGHSLSIPNGIFRIEPAPTHADSNAIFYSGVCAIVNGDMTCIAAINDATRNFVRCPTTFRPVNSPEPRQARINLSDVALDQWSLVNIQPTTRTRFFLLPYRLQPQLACISVGACFGFLQTMHSLPFAIS